MNEFSTDYLGLPVFVGLVHEVSDGPVKRPPHRHLWKRGEKTQGPQYILLPIFEGRRRDHLELVFEARKDKSSRYQGARTDHLDPAWLERF